MTNTTLYEVPDHLFRPGYGLAVGTRARRQAGTGRSQGYPDSKTHATGHLLKKILKFGVALQKLGLKPRNHIAIISENRTQWSLTYLTAMCFDYVVVPVDPKLPANEVLNIIHESESVAIVFSEAFEAMMAESRSSLKNLKYLISMDAPTSRGGIYSMPEIVEQSPGCAPDELPEVDPNEMAEIIFTSGSLGRAKGVMLSQGNLAANLMAMTRMMRITETDRFLMVLPIHHTYACTCGFLCPLYCGGSIHFARSLKTVVDDLQQVHATVLLAVPLLYDKMFKRIHKSIEEKKVLAMLIGPLIKATDLVAKAGWRSCKRQIFGEIHEKFGGSIRLFIAGGAAPDPMVAKGLREFGFNFVQGYGLTETSPILTLNHLDNFKDDAAGIPLPGVSITIHEPDQLVSGKSGPGDRVSCSGTTRTRPKRRRSLKMGGSKPATSVVWTRKGSCTSAGGRRT